MSVKAFAVVLAGCIAFTTIGCAQSDASLDESSTRKTSEQTSSPTSKPAPSPTPDPTPTPTSSPEPEPHRAMPASFVIPECSELVPLERVQALLGADYSEASDAQHMRATFIQFLGPAARTAATEAKQTGFCSWGINNTDAFSSVLIAELSDASRDFLLSELRTSEFVETELSGAAVFTWTPKAYVGPGVRWYAFDGNMWIGAQAMSLSGDVAPDILKSMRRANRDLLAE